MNDPQFVARAEVLRDKGTNRGAYERGEVGSYTWVDLGSSFLPSDVLAAVLAAQLEDRDRIIAQRRVLFGRYMEALAGWAGHLGVRLPVVPDECEPPYHLFYVLLPSRAFRDALLDHLLANGIAAPFHYQPLHRSAFAIRAGYDVSDCPVSEDVSERILRLPLSNAMTRADQELVISAILRFSA